MRLAETKTESVTYVGKETYLAPNIANSSPDSPNIPLFLMTPPTEVTRYFFRTERGEPFSFSCAGPPKLELELEKDEHLELERKYISIFGRKICIDKTIHKWKRL